MCFGIQLPPPLVPLEASNGESKSKYIIAFTCRYSINSSSMSVRVPLKFGLVATCLPGWGNRKQDIVEKQDVRFFLNIYVRFKHL